MKEYIERAAVEKFIEDGLNNPDKNKAFGHDAIEIMTEVHYMPAADVAEVRHGRWIFEPGKIPYCSECKEYSDDGDKGATFCPWCGARMNKEADHD
jgi:hypothetical protein